MINNEGYPKRNQVSLTAPKIQAKVKRIFEAVKAKIMNK